jgi:hypothetical protein
VILKKKGRISAVRLPDLLFLKPVVTVADTSSALGISHQPEYDLVNPFERLGILKEITGKQRYKKYLFTEYVLIIERGTVT